MRKEKGSIAIFVLVALLFMSAFLIISFASNVNKSKTLKEQFNIISGIYSYANGEEGAYDKAYSDLRNKNKQTMTASSENSDILELTKTFDENISNYRIYGNSIQNGTPTPEAPIEVQSVGDLVTDTTDANYGKYKIPINISGENLFNKDLSQIEYAGGTYVTSNGDSILGGIWSDMPKYTGQTTDWYTTGPVEIKPNTTYIYSGFQSGNNPGYFFLNKDKSTIYNGAPIKGNGTFVTPQDAAYIIFSVHKDNISTAQITEETKVNIYLDEPLRKVGDYADYIDFKTGKVVRNIGVIENYNIENVYRVNTNTVRFGTYNAEILTRLDTKEILCEILPYKGEWLRDEEYAFKHDIGQYHFYLSFTKTRLGITDDDTNDTMKQKAKDYLSTLSNKKIYYPMQEVKERSITLPQLKSFEDYTKIEVLTSVAPSKIEAEYIGYTLE